MKTDKSPTNNFSVVFLGTPVAVIAMLVLSGLVLVKISFDLTLVSNQAQKDIETFTIIHKNSEHIF